MRASRDRRVRWGGAGAVVMSVLTAGSWYQTCGFDGCPSVEVLREWRLAHDGTLLGYIDPVRRSPVPLAQVPQHVRDAFVAVEDRRFRDHDGVDWRGVARATVANLRAGGVAEGASTITMQLARNAFLTDEVRGFKRKALEVRYARLLENALDKDEILERYLNTIYFGNGLWGVEAAARDLLGKPIARASRADAALLAGLPKAPSSYNPRRNPKRARERRDVVVGVLVDAGVIDAREADRIRTRSVRPPARAWRPSWPEATWASDVVRATLDSLRKAGTIPAGFAAHDVVVHTTIDRVAQRAAERAVAEGAQRPWWVVVRSRHAASTAPSRRGVRWGRHSSRSCSPPPSPRDTRATACSPMSR
ncbi:MAG: transglycosylase domain-containing protein [Gemmatimonadaceae bacterium]|nr:transglycosylase domain-containing protein [Gemmatimonadaceae bacterium]